MLSNIDLFLFIWYLLSGCWSYIGRALNKEQKIGLQMPGCVTVSIWICILMIAMKSIF